MGPVRLTYRVANKWRERLLGYHLLHRGCSKHMRHQEYLDHTADQLVKESVDTLRARGSMYLQPIRALVVGD